MSRIGLGAVEADGNATDASRADARGHLRGDQGAVARQRHDEAPISGKAGNLEQVAAVERLAAAEN